MYQKKFKNLKKFFHFMASNGVYYMKAIIAFIFHVGGCKWLQKKLNFQNKKIDTIKNESPNVLRY